MAKISFTKVESILTETLRKMMIDRLSELAAIVTLIQDPKTKISMSVIEQILKRFQSELGRLKKSDIKLYQSLGFSAEDEKRFFSSTPNLTPEDWTRLKTLKDKIEELKKELIAHSVPDEKYEKQVEQERLKHENKRFNVKEGWLPLD